MRTSVLVVLCLAGASCQSPAPGRASTPASAGAIYHVATSGNDANAGTEASPWRTIQHAAATMEPGDSVLIHQGVYQETVTPSRSGAEGRYISFGHFGSDTVVIDAQNGMREYCINVSGRKYLRFTGLTLTGASSAAFLAYDDSAHLTLDGLRCQNSRFGIRLYGLVSPVSDVTVTNCVTSGNSKYGIFLYKKVYDSTIGPNNHSFSNGGEEMSWGLEVGTDYPGDQRDGARRIVIVSNEIDHNEVQGIRTWNAANVLIKDNYCHDNGASGIQVEDGSENILVEGNRCEDNARTYEYETGVWVDSSKHVVVRGNTLEGNTIGVTVTATAHAVVQNNLIVNNRRGVPDAASARGVNVKSASTDVVIAHNTIFGNGAPESTRGGISIFEASAAVFKNNIVANTQAAVDLWVDQDYVSESNTVFNDRRPASVQWKGVQMSWSQYVGASGQDARSVQADPLFVAPLAGDFRLKDASPCRNTATFLTRTRSAGVGKVVDLEDARYFTDGFGLTVGDAIVVGGRPAVLIVAVDPTLDRITVERDLSWDRGDPVFYQYAGAGPDIGAYGRVRDGSAANSPPGLRGATSESVAGTARRWR